jgi:cytochrome c oxidase assembly protein subunit 11
MATLTRIEERQEANRRLGLKLLWVVGGSILFAVSLVPLYDVFCTVNGKTQNTAAQSTAVVDENRWVKIEFTSSVMPGLSWNFHPQQNSIMVRPGKIETVLFEARNMTNQVVAGQAVPSVSPGSANNYLKKIECFCFVRQELQPGETKLMPLRFYVSPELPEKVEAITLSYAFFSAVDKVEQGESAAF